MSTPTETDNVPLDLTAYLGHQITLAIVAEEEPGGRPEISLFIGILGTTDDGYEISASRDSKFQIPASWLPKVKIMDERVKAILGGSDLLLSISKTEVEKAGVSYMVDSSGAIHVEVQD